jgi:hypothetical protein
MADPQNGSQSESQSDSQTPTPPPERTLSNFIPYPIQRLREIKDLIDSDTIYANIPDSDDGTADDDISLFRLNFRQVVTLVANSEPVIASFIIPSQSEWDYKFERMKEISAEWPQVEYYHDLVTRAKYAFIDFLDWCITADYTQTTVEDYITIFFED